MQGRLVLVALVTLLSACASNTMSLQRASAIAIGNNTNPDAVAVSDVDRGMMNVRWTATAGGRTYSCTADDMVRQTVCTPQ